MAGGNKIEIKDTYYLVHLIDQLHKVQVELKGSFVTPIIKDDMYYIIIESKAHRSMKFFNQDSPLPIPKGFYGELLHMNYNNPSNPIPCKYIGVTLRNRATDFCKVGSKVDVEYKKYFVCEVFIKPQYRINDGIMKYEKYSVRWPRTAWVYHNIGQYNFPKEFVQYLYGLR